MVHSLRKELARLKGASARTAIVAIAVMMPISEAWAQDASAQQDASGQNAVPDTGGQSPSVDPSPAEAAETDSGIAEIVVTAQKRAENLQDVPISVTSVSADRIEAVGVVDTKGLSTVVSGLSIGTTAGNFSAYIRGVGTTAYGIGIESPVALYIDGVYYGAQTTGLVNMVDVSQVTVLKGPQGTLFGRNATGGVVQLSTRDPKDRFGGEFRSEIDNYATWRSNAYLTGPLSDGIKANLSLGYTTQGEGWGENEFTGNENHKLDRELTVRSKVFVEAGETTDIKVNFDYLDRKDSINGNIVPAKGTTPDAPGFIRSSNPYDTYSSVDPVTKLKSGGASIEINQDLGFGQLTSISAFRKYDFKTRFDASLSSIPQLIQVVDFKGKQFTQELQLLSKDNSWLNWVLGGYYFYAKDKEPAVHGFYSNTYSLTHFFTPDAEINQVGEGKTSSLAVFGQATAELLTDTSLTLGLRYSMEKRKIKGQIFLAFFDASVGPPEFFSTPPIDASMKLNKLTWRAALDHKFTPDILGYVSYNRGFKSGGFNGFNLSENNPYNPEVVDTFEAGLKTVLFDRRLRLNTSVFFNKYKDIQIIQFIALPTLDNAAKAKTYGIDLDIEARLTDQLTLNGGLEWLHAEYGKGSEGTVTRFVGAEGGQTVSSRGDISGNRLPFAPKLTYNIGATYTIPTRMGEVDLNVTDSYSSSFFLSEANFIAQKGYHYLNTSLTWRPDNLPITASIWGRNLLDKAVASFLTNGALGYSADYANPPRTFGATITLRFGS